MSPSKAIATGLLCSQLLGWLSVRTPTNADELSILDLGEAVSVPIEQVDGYAEITDSNFSADTAAEIAFLPPSANQEDALPEMFGVPYSPSDECESCGAIIDHDCCEVAARSGWIIELGASALQSDMATSDLEAWPEDFGAAGRISVGYEWESGLGIRTQAWGYSMEGDIRSESPLVFGYYNYPNSLYDYIFYSYYITPGALNRLLIPQNYSYNRRIELTADTVYLDFYKSFLSRHGEFSVGMGPAFGNLEFNFPPAGDGMQYYGGGVTAFAQAYLRFIKWGPWELAMTGRTRMTLLTGSWDIDLLNTDSEHSENMSILELTVGPEIRRRVGSSGDRYLFIRTSAEFQQWRSDRMGPIAGDTLGLQGASLDFGLLW